MLDINNLASGTMRDTNASASGIATWYCLMQLHHSLDYFSEPLHLLVLLVRLASEMVDMMDEKAVIQMLSVEAPHFLKSLEGRQQGINLMVVGTGHPESDPCPQNGAVAAATADKIVRIYSDAASLVGSIVKKIGASSSR
jgi:hypothetical protein